MVELVDTYALGAYALQRAGSSPVPGTTHLTMCYKKQDVGASRASPVPGTTHLMMRHKKQNVGVFSCFVF